MKSIIAGEVIKIIDEKCMKQSSVAQRAGYKPNQFCDMLHGRRQIYDTDIPRIAEALGVTPNRLFGLDDRENA